MTLSAVSLADEWVPIRPGTDAAHDVGHGLRHDHRGAPRQRTSSGPTASGSTRAQMPPGCEAEESYEDYILGTRDGVAKTPGLGRADHRRSAGDDRPARPRVRDDQAGASSTRATGCRGGPTASRSSGPAASWRRSPATSAFPGGWAGGIALQAPDGGPSWIVFPTGDNPVTAAIPSLPLDGGRPPGQGDGARRTASRAPTGSARTSSSSGPWPQLPRQPARQRQPDGAHPRGREARRVPRRPGQLPDADRPVRRPPPPGLHPVRDVGRRRTAGSTGTRSS